MPDNNQDTDDRTELASEADGEIMCIVQMLEREVSQDCFDTILRGALRRIYDLSSICMSVTNGDSDEGRTTAEMHQVIFGNQLKAA